MEIFYYGNKQSNSILIQLVDDYDLSLIPQEKGYIDELTNNAEYLLVAIKVDNWNHDTVPWSAPASFGNEDFGNGANETLEFILDNVIKPFNDTRNTFYIGGYSLGGLFALWASYQIDVFEGVNAASPSVWYPNFKDYVHQNVIKTKSVYLSLGDKEEKTKNEVMKTVGDAIRDIHSYFQANNIDCILEWNVGNHFKESDLRTAKGFAWLLNNNK